MRSLDVDVAIVGAGSAGMSAYRAAVKEGARTVLIESGRYGTTCADHGCMPSKLLIAAANAAFETRLLSGFGIELGAPIVVDGERVMARVRHERDRFVAGVLADVASFPAADKIRGRARFVADDTLAITAAGQAGSAAPHAAGPNDATSGVTIETVHARAIVIATGARPTVPAGFDALGPALVTSDTVFDWQTLPARVAVIGTGVIAIELGQALSRLGVQVTVFGQRPVVAALRDHAVNAFALRQFQGEFPLHFNAQATARALPDGTARIAFADAEGQPRELTVDRVLVATGRAPVLDDLGWENTRVTRDAKGAPGFDAATMQCGDAPIFIAGDADGQRPWLADAANEGRIAGRNAARWPHVEPAPRPVVMSVVFSDPGILAVGAHADALDPRKTVTGVAHFENQGRSRVTQKNHGLLHVYADLDSGRLLGAEGMTPAAEHFAHLLAWAIQQSLTLDDLLGMPFYHPVFEEGVRTALRDACAKRSRALPDAARTAMEAQSDTVGM